tara:strand:+ start:88 stop:858 length:771 start_codon:yes stop_codon:yes gene_type:complete
VEENMKNRYSSRYKRSHAQTLEQATKWDSNYDWDISVPQWKRDIAKVCGPYTVTELDSVLNLIDSVEEIILNNIPGALVECGVYMGGSSMVMAQVCEHYGSLRKILMFDTYNGVPAPDDHETFNDGTLISDWLITHEYDMDAEGSNWCYSNIAHVKENVSIVNYSGDIEFVVGLVEDTLPMDQLNSIALLRIDVDLESPTRHVLNHLYPVLNSGGILILDDYGHFPMVRKTVDDYFAPEVIKYNEVTYTVRQCVKS